MLLILENIALLNYSLISIRTDGSLKVLKFSLIILHLSIVHANVRIGSTNKSRRELLSLKIQPIFIGVKI